MWKLIFCILSTFLLAKFISCDLDHTFHHCCALGRNKTFEPLKCDSMIRTPITGIAIEEQSLCLSTAELCCIETLRDTACKHGKQAAKNGRTCVTEFRTEEDLSFKYCCEACKVGVVAGSMSMCYPKTFKFDPPWDQVFKSCCEELNQTIIDLLPSASTKTPNMCDLFPGELCDHICISVGGSYRCQCRNGFSLLADGKSCQEEVGNRCDRNNPCDQKCFDNGLSVECSCHGGFILLSDRISCEDIDECKDGSHQCNSQTHSCVNYAGGYRCEPKKDVDECEAKPCKDHERCVNTIGSFRCDCKPGFSRNPITFSCTDINECENNPCDSHQVCQNTVGSFVCTCASGFQRDRISNACVDINECQTRKHDCDPVSQRCDNTIGSYHCVRNTGCGTGYTFNSQSSRCEDDDECALGIHDCHTLGPDYECKNYVGTFRCTKKQCTNSLACGPAPKCSVGYLLVEGKCVDINECANANTCSRGYVCQNTPGSFRCILNAANSCGGGFHVDDTSNRCIDIDECSEQPNICDHTCINTYGSFQCSCQPGYILHNDNRSCVDINECELFKNRRVCAATCVNEPGSYRCACPSGYKLGLDSASCIDIDECLIQNKCRSPEEICMNMRGSYRCNSIICPTDYVPEAGRKK